MRQVSDIGILYWVHIFMKQIDKLYVMYL